MTLKRIPSSRETEGKDNIKNRFFGDRQLIVRSRTGGTVIKTTELSIQFKIPRQVDTDVTCRYLLQPHTHTPPPSIAYTKLLSSENTHYNINPIRIGHLHLRDFLNISVPLEIPKHLTAFCKLELHGKSYLIVSFLLPFSYALVLIRSPQRYCVLHFYSSVQSERLTSRV